jgi:hypothetical protein
VRRMRRAWRLKGRNESLSRRRSWQSVTQQSRSVLHTTAHLPPICTGLTRLLIVVQLRLLEEAKQNLHDATFTEERATAEAEEQRTRVESIEAEDAYEHAKSEVVRTITAQDQLEMAMSTEFQPDKVAKVRAEYAVMAKAADHAIKFTQGNMAPTLMPCVPWQAELSSLPRCSR